MMLAASPMTRYLLEAGITLLAVVALAIVVLYAARRAGVGRAGGPLQLMGRLPLDARRAVYLVRVGSKTLVVGASEAGLTRLGELDSSELPAPTPPRPDPFATVLARALGRTPRDTSSPSEPPPHPPESARPLEAPASAPASHAEPDTASGTELKLGADAASAPASRPEEAT